MPWFYLFLFLYCTAELASNEEGLRHNCHVLAALAATSLKYEHPGCPYLKVSCSTTGQIRPPRPTKDAPF
jgi:hypothetical protein